MDMSSFPSWEGLKWSGKSPADVAETCFGQRISFMSQNLKWLVKCCARAVLSILLENSLRKGETVEVEQCAPIDLDRKKLRPLNRLSPLKTF